MTATSAAAPAGTSTATRARTGRLRFRRNPWGHPWFLEGFTWL